MKNFITSIRQKLSDWCETRQIKSNSIKWEIFWGNLGHKVLGLK